MQPLTTIAASIERHPLLAIHWRKILRTGTLDFLHLHELLAVFLENEPLQQFAIAHEWHATTTLARERVRAEAHSGSATN